MGRFALRRNNLHDVTLRVAVESTKQPKDGAMSLTSKVFWRDALERAVKTFAQSALATLGLGATDILSADWVGVLSVGGGAAIISILTSLASEPRGDTLSPASVVKPTP